MATSVRRIRAKNPDLTRSEKTQLDADYSTGTTLTVVSNFGFQDNDIVVVGEPGTEKSEATDVTGTTSNTTVNISASLKFAHQSGTPVYRSEFDRVEFSTMAPGGSWTVLDTVGIKWDADETLFIHQGGTNSDSYRFRFTNSVSGNTSEYSPTATGAGFANNQIGFMIQEVRDIILDPDGKIVSNTEIIKFFNKAKNIIAAKRPDWWFWFKQDLGTITTVSGTRKYSLSNISSNLEYIKDVRFRDISNNDDIIYQLRHLQDTVFDSLVVDNKATQNDAVRFYNMVPPDTNSSAGYIRVDPIPQNTGNGSFHVRYYESDSDFNDVSDTTLIPIPHILEDYAIFRSEQIKGDDRRSRIYKDLFFGPPDKAKDISDLSGVALLEAQQNARLQPSGQPRSLKVFRGRKPLSKFYGNNVDSSNRDRIVEAFF